MNRNTLSCIFIALITLYSGTVQSCSSDSISINFASGLYPATPMKNVQSLTMQLWSYVDGAYLHSSTREYFLKGEKVFSEKIAYLHSMIDFLLLTLSEESIDSPDSVVKAIQDFDLILHAVVDMNKKYRLITEKHVSHYTHSVVFLLDLIQMKLTEVIEKQSVTSVLHAFFSGSKKACKTEALKNNYLNSVVS